MSIGPSKEAFSEMPGAPSFRPAHQEQAGYNRSPVSTHPTEAAMKRVLVPLAESFEEIEAITVIDVLRRAGIEVVAAGLHGADPIRASRGVVVLPDAPLDAVLDQHFDMIVLPGGMPGAAHLHGDPRIKTLLQTMEREGRQIAAICAAPWILADAGLLHGRKATSHPNFSEKTEAGGADYQEADVVVEGHLTTSRGPGTAMAFALVLVRKLAPEMLPKVLPGLVLSSELQARFGA